MSRRGAEGAETEGQDIDAVTDEVIAQAVAIHRDLGPGLLESVYEALLAARLQRIGYRVERQLPVDLHHDGLNFPAALKVDLLVDGRLVVEIKSVEEIKPVHAKQVLTYIRILQQPVGLLINFSGETLVSGVRRLVNGYRPSASSAPLRDNI